MTHSSYLSARCWLAQPEHSKSTQLIPWHIELPDISELECLFCMRTLLLLECWFWQVATWHNARIGYNDGIIINSEELTLTGSRGGRVWCYNNTALHYQIGGISTSKVSATLPRSAEYPSLWSVAYLLLTEWCQQPGIPTTITLSSHSGHTQGAMPSPLTLQFPHSCLAL